MRDGRDDTTAWLLAWLHPAGVVQTLLKLSYFVVNNR